MVRRFAVCRVTLLLFGALIFLLGSIAVARPGGRDAAFGRAGTVRTNFTPRDDHANDVAIQADGKILAVGLANSGPQGRRGTFAIARYNPDGTLDPSFGGDGKVETNFTPWDDHANGVAIQIDGKIVAVGVGNSKFALARYNPDGTPDTSFDGDGKVLTYPVGGATGVAIQADGKIVAAGEGSFGGQLFAVARYNPDGTLDTSFGGDGRVLNDFGGLGFAFDVAIQADGKIVAAGGGGLGAPSFALTRYNPDGSLDPSFGGDGQVITGFPTRPYFYSTAEGLAIQADGKIVAVGTVNDVGFAVARYNPDGTRDTTFSQDGRAITRFWFRGNSYATGVAIQADGKMVAAGSATPPAIGPNGDDTRFALVRYRPNGTLDATFGGDGKVWTNLSAGYDYANDVAIQADGKILAVGSVAPRANSNNAKFAIVRYLGT